MKNLSICIAVFAIGLTLIADYAEAQRRGGGGARGGGGRSFSGGGGSRGYSGGRSMSSPSRSAGSSSINRGSMGGYSRPSTSRSPSNYSRPSNSMNRSGGSINRSPGAANRSPNSMNRSPGSVNRSAGGMNRSAGNLNRSGNMSNRPNTGQRAAGQYQKPSRNQINDFLNMPSGSGASRNNATARSNNAGSRGTPNEAGGKTFEGDNFTVDTFRGSGSGSKGDVNYAGAGGGAVITDSEGNKRVVGGSVGGATDGTSSVVGRGSFAGGKNTDGSAGAVRSGTRVGTDGNSVGVSRGAGGVARDSAGNVRGGAAGGRVATDGTNTVASGGAVRGQRNSDGSGAVTARGGRGATDGSNTVVQRGAAGAVQDQYGNVRGGAAGGTRARDAYGNTYAQGGAVRFAKDPAGNAVASGRYATGYNGVVTSRQQAYAVRNGFTGYTRYYTRGWYARYPGAWFAAGVVASSWWNAPSYGYVAGYAGYAEEPVYYEYGDEAIYADGGNVYAGEEIIATEEEYYDQAEEIADSFEENEDEEDWLPLGVFAVVSEGQTKSDMTLQLAMNQEGMIRGNLKLDLTDEVIPVSGRVDKESQRVAFKMEGKDNIVVEAGLYNLTEDVLTVWVHHGKDRHEERGLIRLTQDQDQTDGAAGANADEEVNQANSTGNEG